MTEDNRIPEIRAELASWHTDGPPVPRDVLNRIRAILDSAPPVPGPGCYPPIDGWDGVAAPRVWFPGETVPAGTPVVNHVGGVWRHHADRVVKTGHVIEILLPPPAEHAALVDRVQAEREEADRG